MGIDRRFHMYTYRRNRSLLCLFVSTCWSNRHVSIEIPLNILVKQTGIDRKFYTPVLFIRTLPTVKTSLNQFVKEVSIDRQRHPSVAPGNRYRYATPHLIDRPIAIINK